MPAKDRVAAFIDMAEANLHIDAIASLSELAHQTWPGDRVLRER